MTRNNHENPSDASDSAPLVSVVVPVFNVERYLAECLDSVLGQTLENIEIICVNDGSSDASLDILEKYAQRDSRVSVVSQRNCGQATARNRGLDLARGQYVYFLDSDDLIAPQALHDLYQCAKRRQLDIVLFDMKTFFDSEELQNRHPNMEFRPRKGHYPGVWDGASMFAAMTENKDYRISVCIYFIRTGLLRDTGLRFIEGAILEDNSFVLMLMMLAEKAYYIKETYYRYRVRPNSTMTSPIGTKNIIGYITQSASIFRFIQSRSLPERATASAHQRIAFLHRQAASLYRSLPHAEREQISFVSNSMEALLYAMIKELDRWLESRAKVTNNDSQKELMQAQARLSALTAEMELLRRSNALRIGKAFTAIPRKLRSLVLSREKHS